MKHRVDPVFLIIARFPPFRVPPLFLRRADGCRVYSTSLQRGLSVSEHDWQNPYSISNVDATLHLLSLDWLCFPPN